MENFVKLIYLISRVFWAAWTFLNFLARCGGKYLIYHMDSDLFKILVPTFVGNQV